MANILISGLCNVETSVRVRQFPIPYYPIDYPFFGVNSAVSGVAFNIAKAMDTLGDTVRLYSMIGQDFQGDYIRNALTELKIDVSGLIPCLKETATSVVLYDEGGRRQVYCDLKDVQERKIAVPVSAVEKADVVVACNTNFNRPLLHLAKELGKCVATDVHVLSDIYDEYNREFLECADIVFLSDEAIGEDYRPFLTALTEAYPMKILVLGRGSRGAAMYLREEHRLVEMSACAATCVVNTVGAGDALFSGFLHYLTRGCSPEESLRWAQMFAARKIAFSGASNGFATEEEVQAMWESGII